MAKMFYTLDEAAAKLGMSTDEVQGLVESGQLQEFRDRDNLMFKVDQVDLLAGDDDDGDDEITLADTGGGIEPISLSSSGSGGGSMGIGLESSGEATGISIFDPEDADGVDANAETLVSGGAGMPAMGGSGFGMDAGASGSGLSQLAFEPDDTSLGGNLLDDLGGESQVSASALGASAIGESAMGASTPGALFEGAEESHNDFTPAAAGGAMPMGVAMGEPYDGPASGLFGGIALGAFVVLLLALAVMILGMSGGSASVLGMVDQNMLYMVMGGGAVLMIVMGVIGWVMLRKS